MHGFLVYDYVVVQTLHLSLTFGGCYMIVERSVGCCAIDMLLCFLMYQCVHLCDHLPSPNGASFVDCSTVHSMPTVSFTIAGKRFELTPEEVSYLFLPSWPHSATPSPT